eukprot:scaffold24280_cov55-Cyclotella_meneghiniana.AAC.10
MFVSHRSSSSLFDSRGSMRTDQKFSRKIQTVKRARRLNWLQLQPGTHHQSPHKHKNKQSQNPTVTTDFDAKKEVDHSDVYGKVQRSNTVAQQEIFKSGTPAQAFIVIRASSRELNLSVIKL